MINLPKTVAACVQFSILMTVKTVFRCFYRFEVPVHTMHLEDSKPDYSKVKLFLLLNHTSLFEPAFLAGFSNSLLWQMSNRFVYPVATKTMKKPLFNRIFRSLAPKTVPISRKRDGSWEKFINEVEADSMVGIAPEGHMKRTNGLDGKGCPLVVRPGFTDVMKKLDGGQVMILYSGGLHHVQAPGTGLPKPFKTIRGRLEIWSREVFTKQATSLYPELEYGEALAKFVTLRRDLFCDYKVKQPAPIASFQKPASEPRLDHTPTL